METMAGSPGSPSPETEEIAAKPATAPELRVQQRTHIVLPVQIAGNWSCYDDYVVGNSGTNQSAMSTIILFIFNVKRKILALQPSLELPRAELLHFLMIAIISIHSFVNY
ncbi:hypothetical protein EJB05_19542, partial [Eragrostis curvula]